MICPFTPEELRIVLFFQLIISLFQQINMSHYMMVAKLSNRCFRLVLRIPESLNLRVTQSDFLDLYGKSEEKQCELLRAVLEGTISFQDLKRRRVSLSGSAFIA